MTNPVREAPRPELLTIREAAIRLGISRDTIYRLVRSDDLRRVKVGAGTRITSSSIDAYLERLGAADGGNGG